MKNQQRKKGSILGCVIFMGLAGLSHLRPVMFLPPMTTQLHCLCCGSPGWFTHPQTSTPRPANLDVSLLFPYIVNQIIGSLGFIWLVKSESHVRTWQQSAGKSSYFSDSVLGRKNAHSAELLILSCGESTEKNLGKYEWQMSTIINVPKSSLEFKLYSILNVLSF